MQRISVPVMMLEMSSQRSCEACSLLGSYLIGGTFRLHVLVSVYQTTRRHISGDDNLILIPASTWIFTLRFEMCLSAPWYSGNFSDTTVSG